MVSVVLITVGMTAVFANRVANAEVDKRQDRGDTERSLRLSDLAAELYTRDGSWRKAQDLVLTAGILFGQRVVLVSEAGQVVADTHEDLLGRFIAPGGEGWPSRGIAFPVAASGRRLGTLVVDPAPMNQGPIAPLVLNGDSGPSLNLLLVLSGLLAVAVALVLTFFLSCRIVAPVESLARAANAVARRDFTVRALTDSKDEVGQLTRTFNSMVAELARSDELRRNLVSDLAHELRTPVTNIRGYIEGMADGLIEVGGETLDSMQDEVLLLTRLIEDLQDLALAESGRMQLRLETCNLGLLARQAAAAVGQRAQAKQIALRVDAPAELPVLADPQRITQVMRNLLVNAVEYTPTGGWVSVKVWDDALEAHVEVSDSGPGIPAEDLPRIFERFYRVDKSRSRATGGVGLGLTIAHRLVQAHGGEIDVRSDPGSGAQFSVRLPHLSQAF